MRKLFSIGLGILWVFLQGFAFGAEVPAWLLQDGITGDWLGTRPVLGEHGLDLEFVYTGEVIATLDGGIQRDADYLHNFDLVLEADLQKLIGWPGAKVFIYGLGNNGGDPTATDVGDFQGVSSIEAPDTWKLYEAWFEQNLFGERLSVLGGLHDVNSEFDVNETGSLFLNGSHGMGPDFSQSGVNGPSIFSTTSLGGRVRVRPWTFFYIQGAVYDGVPGDDQSVDYPDESGTEAHFEKDEGVLVVSETGIVLGEEDGWGEDFFFGRYLVGFWVYTADFADLVLVDLNDEPILRDGNFGIYGLAEQQVFREKDDPEQGLALFIRMGWANPNFNDVEWYTGGGAVYTGLIPTRDQDQLGVAVAAVHVGDESEQAAFSEGNLIDREEINIEVSYRIQILPWLAVQPDFQYIIHPGFSKAVQNAAVFGTRWEMVIW